MRKTQPKIVAVIGSCRRGNTFAMVEAACRALMGKCDFTVIDLRKTNTRPCNGCLRCDETGICPLRDDMRKILQKIASADGFIFGTPTRWSLLSGELKIFMDRLNPLASRETLKGKKAVLFAVGQSSKKNGKSVKLARDSVASFCDNAGIKVIKSVLAYDCLKASDVKKKSPAVLVKCAKAASALLRSLI